MIFIKAEVDKNVFKAVNVKFYLQSATAANASGVVL